MSTFTILHSLADLAGTDPELPQIELGTHRCAQCARLAYRRRDAACQAADELGRRTVLDCDQAGCNHTVLPEEPEHAPKTLSPLRGTTTCGKTGKIRYSSETLAMSAAHSLNDLSRRGSHGRKKKRSLNAAYYCGHCKDWHLTSDTS